MFHIVLTHQIGNAGYRLFEADSQVTVHLVDPHDEKEFTAQVKRCHALLVDSETQLDQSVLASAKNLKVIGRTGIRVRNIDLDFATHQGIMVINTPQANAGSAAEHTLALMLALCRQIPESNANFAQKDWRVADLANKTLGIVGLGAIGRLVAAKAQAFDMQVLAMDPYVSEIVGRDLGVTLVDMDDLLAESDIISLHTVVTEETVQLINQESIQKMKDGAFLINVASGRLINGDALAAALKSQKLAGVALDGVLGSSPEDDPLCNLPNVIRTPSLATKSSEAIAAVSSEIARNVLDALHGNAYRNVINMAWPVDGNVDDVQPYVDLARTIGHIQRQLVPETIGRVEIEISGDDMRPMVRAMAAGLLTGLLETRADIVNHINAPFIAKDCGLHITQEYGIGEADYSNLITCRAQWRDENGTTQQKTIAGVLFGGREPRIVQVDEYRIEAKPEGTMLVLRNKDIPGVIGQVATLLATYQVNIAEWRLGREAPGSEALSFINLDGEPPDGVMHALSQAPAVTSVNLIHI
ncbi:MAG: phosphoglycerate dehydrogenase [Chloroflexota bacterium]